MDKEFFKKLLQLDEPIFIEKFASTLASYAKLVYLVGLVILAISAFGAVVALFTGAFAGALLSVIAIIVEFVLLRMFCEFLLTYKK